MTKKSIKILYINGSFSNDSGCGVMAKNTYILFASRYKTVHYYTTKEFTEDKNYRFYKYFPSAINSLLKYLVYIWSYYYNWNSRYGLEKLLSEFHPDIVHIHSLYFPSMTYAVIAPIIKRKIPIVMTLHDVYLLCPILTLQKGNGEPCEKCLCKGYNKFHCFFNKCAPKGYEQSFRMALMSFVNKLTGYDKLIKKFITPSNALKELMIKYNNDIDEDKIITINNFLSNDELKVTPSYKNKGYFLYIGRLSKEKGVNYLLEAIKDLPRNIKLKIVGTGPEENDLKKYAKENNLYNVEFIGFKNREEIKEEYQNCIATILPCNWFEIFGMTNIESFVNGKPVIASKIGGIPEIVEHNVNGLLFEPANVEQLKKHILTYWNNPELVIEHGKNAYQKAIIQYSEERYYQQLSGIYEELVNSNEV